MERIEKLRIAILEEGMLPEYRDELVGLLERVKRQGQLAAEWEADLKAVWLDAYLRGEIEKTVTVNGVKVQCTDAGEPKETRVEGRYEIDVDKLLTDYDPQVLVETGIATWVPPTVKTSYGRKANVSVTLPKG